MRNCVLIISIIVLSSPLTAYAEKDRQTTISISGQTFLINNHPTYEGRTYNGMKIEGLLLNARLVQATFDDLNPATRHLWKYPDGKDFDADRNTDEFLAALPLYQDRKSVV